MEGSGHGLIHYAALEKLIKTTNILVTISGLRADI